MLTVRDAREGVLEKRMESQQASLVIAIIAVATFAILATTYLITIRYSRSFQAARQTNPSSSDKPSFSLFSWRPFRRRPRRHEYSTSLQDTEYRGHTSREMSRAVATDPERQDHSVESAGVDRNTSVRSVMTLPAYSPAVRDNERVLAREGERGGIDCVVELPETLEEEEQHREEEMESLYQIRLARRVEAADREARRQARREARERGDVHALADLRRRAEEAADLSVSQMLIMEHQNRTSSRDRRVSSVAYGDLGVARHDGTRLRTNSLESDHRPLLGSAESISGQSSRSRAHTNNTLDLADFHHRGRSVTSFSPSINSDFDFADTSRPFSQSNGGDSQYETAVSLYPGRSRSNSAVPSPIAGVPREEAPAYEDPPHYESPVDVGAPRLPVIETLPSIQITTEPTPVEERSQFSLAVI